MTFCARSPFATLRVETPDGVLESQPRVLTDPAAGQPADWVLVVTKTYDAPGAQLWLGRLVGPDTHVAILQNRVEHRSRFPGIDAARIVPVIVDIPAERRAPGRVVQRRSGSLTVPDDAVPSLPCSRRARSPRSSPTTG